MRELKQWEYKISIIKANAKGFTKYSILCALSVLGSKSEATMSDARKLISNPNVSAAIDQLVAKEKG